MESEKKNMDPGWNDPPIFSYTESAGHVRTPKRNLLTKRVAYPVSGGVKNEQSTSVPVLPPSNAALPPPITLPPPVTLPPSSVPPKVGRCDAESKVPLNIDLATSESMLQTVLDDVEQILNEKEQSLQNQGKHEQIKKRIHILEETWKTKLSDDIKVKILNLSTAMRDHDKNRANEIQASLMVDFPKLCGEFIPAFRMLINTE